MQFKRIKPSAALALAGLPVLLAGPLAAAAQDTGVRTVAEELGSRTKTQAASEGGQKAGMSDSRVRVMSTYALSILPDEMPDGKGNRIKLDKSDPNIYLIPLDDARRIIRVATRSAYAEACQLKDLQRANFEAMYQTEVARNVWSKQQLMFIEALHTFSTSYFAGNVKITEAPADAPASKAASETTTIAPKKLQCAPGQREKVASAIGNYVKSTGVTVQPPQLPQAATPQETAPQTAPPQAEAPAMPGMSGMPEMAAPAPMAPVPMAPVAGSAN